MQALACWKAGMRTAALARVEGCHQAVLRAAQELRRLVRQPGQRLHVGARIPAQCLPVGVADIRLCSSAAICQTVTVMWDASATCNERYQSVLGESLELLSMPASQWI